MITAIIEPDKDSKEALWLLVDRDSTKVTSTHGLSEIFEGCTKGKVAYAIHASEVEAIRNACNRWLEEESQRIMIITIIILVGLTGYATGCLVRHYRGDNIPEPVIIDSVSDFNLDTFC